MHVITRKALLEYGKKYPDAKGQLDAWYGFVKKEKWNNFSDVKKFSNSADLIKGHIVVFNIKGNHYRLEVGIAFKISSIYIKWFGTHKEYYKRNKERR